MLRPNAISLPSSRLDESGPREYNNPKEITLTLKEVTL
jgi:hypothetical protein